MLGSVSPDGDAHRPQIVQARGISNAAWILTMAGLGWAILGLAGLGKVPVLALLPPATVFAALLAGTRYLEKRVKPLPEFPEDPAFSRVFRRAIAFEVVFILVGVNVCHLLHRPSLTVPVTAVGVGLHFFPLARVLRRPLYHVTGVSLCLIGVVVPLLMPPTLGPAGRIVGWQLAAGLCGGVILWLTASALIVIGLSLIKKINAAPAIS